MDSSIYAFTTDLRDEGIETVLDNVQHGAGLSGIALAAAYREGRDIFPHNPLGKVRFLESGAIFFRARLPCRLQPPVSDAADVLPEVIRAVDRRGLEAHAWTVFLHNGALAEANPDCAPENAFGDRYVTELCAANPDARTYAVVLAGAVAELGVQTVIAESLHFHGLEHGYAHERYFVPLGERARFLLGLCFCRYCLDAVRRRGVPAADVRRAVREELEASLAEAEEEPLETLDLGGYVETREQTVTTLVAECAAATHLRDAHFEFLDPSGAVKGYATGRPEGGPAPEIAWRFGVDPQAVADVCDGVEAIGYVAGPARLRLNLEAYGAAAASVVLRPALPDCETPSNLRAKVDLAFELGARRVDFYHYGLMRLDALDWIRTALLP